MQATSREQLVDVCQKLILLSDANLLRDFQEARADLLRNERLQAKCLRWNYEIRLAAERLGDEAAKVLDCDRRFARDVASEVYIGTARQAVLELLNEYVSRAQARKQSVAHDRQSSEIGNIPAASARSSRTVGKTPSIAPPRRAQ